MTQILQSYMTAPNTTSILIQYKSLAHPGLTKVARRLMRQLRELEIQVEVRDYAGEECARSFLLYFCTHRTTKTRKSERKTPSNARYVCFVFSVLC